MREPDDQPQDEPRDDGWLESTEGDLDPDLTDEASWSWEPPRHRALGGPVLRLGLMMLLVLFVASIVIAALR